MQRGRKIEAVGTLIAIAGVIAAVAATGPMWYVAGTLGIFVGFVVFVIGRFL